MPLAPTLDAPRLGERSGGSSAAGFLRAHAAAAWPSALLLLWALAGALGLVLGAASPFMLLGVGAGALALAFALARTTPRAAALLVTVGAGIALAGRVPLLPGALGLGILVAGLVAVPLLAGWRVRALALALRATGRRPRGLPLRALDAETGDDLVRARRPPWRGLAAALLEGWLLPGVLALDLVGRAANTIAGSETMHARFDADAVRQALLGSGAAVEEKGRSLVVTLSPEQGGGRATLRASTLRFPRGEPAISIRGPPAARRTLRTALEAEAGVALTFAWTDAGRRIEARLNALLCDSLAASTLEERSALYEDAQRLERLLDARDLLHDDWVALRAWKAHRARLLLAQKLLSEPVGPRPEGRVVAPAPAMRPDLARVMAAGGLGALRHAVFVPHWIVPVRTPWGEREIVVNALTGKPGPGGARLIEVARATGPGLLLDMPRGTRFLQAPEPTAALLRDLRTMLPGGVEVTRATEAPADWLLVPYLPSGDAYVSGVTDEVATDLGVPPGLVATPA